MAENLQSEAFNSEALDVNANIPMSESASMLTNLGLDNAPDMMDMVDSANVPPLVTVIDSEVKAASDKFKEISPVLAPGFDGGSQPKPSSSMAFAEGAGSQMIASQQWSSPTNYHMAGDRMYGANVDGRRFAKWYNHNEFDDVGFHPYRNNNDYYLKYTTGWDDFQSAASMELFSRGMADQASSWVEWNKSTDPYAAQLFADQLDLMHSDREGFWGSASNIFGSLQYSLGAITEFAAEEVVLAAITTASEGGAAPFTLPRMLKNMTQLSRTLTTGSELLRTIRTVNKAKDFYQGARFAAVGAGKTINAFANPFFRSSKLAYDSVKGIRSGKTMTQIAQGRTMFGEFFRDMSEINMAMSESRLEGGMVQNDIINEVIKQKGSLTNEELNRLNEIATIAGASTTKANAPAIYYTNKITLNNMFRGIGRASDRLLAVGTAIGGKAVRDGGKTVILETGFKAGLSRLNPFAKNTKLYYKHVLQTSPSRLKNLFIAGAPEGLQENFQEMVSTGYKDYYTKLYLTPQLAQSAGMRASFQKGLDEQFTAQGLETFLSGFAIGGVMGKYGQALNFATKTAPSMIADKLGIDKTYSNVKKQRAEFKKEFMDVVAIMDTNPQAFFNMIDSDLAQQVSFEDFITMGRNAGSNHAQLEGQDLALFKKLHTLFKSGQTDLLKDTLTEFLNLEDKDLQAAFPGVKLEADENNKSLRERLENSIDKIDMMKKSFEEAQSLKNHYNPWQYDQVKDKEKFEEEMYNYIAFEDVRFDLALMKTKLVTAQDYISEITARASKSKPLQSMSGIAFTNMLTRGGISTEVELLTKERLVYAEAAATSDEAAQKLKQIDEELSFYKNYLATFDIVTDKLKSAALDYAKNRDKIQRDPITGDIVDPITADIENSITDLRNAFYSLLKHKAGVNKDMVLDENIDKAFNNLIEMMQHGSDLSNAVDALNRLYDPEGFNLHHGRIKDALEFVHKNAKIQREKIWDALQHKNDLNAFLNNLINKGIFFDPKFVKAFEDDGILPDEFIDAENMETIDHNHPKYKEVLQQIDNFERSTGKTLSGKPISEFQNEYSVSRMEKDATDKRILRQIYAQFNLDIDQFDQSVSLQEILKAVSVSGFAGKYDKFLAKKLMSLVSDKIQIRFVKNATVPVRFSETGGIVVDARFASSDYIGGTLRLESLILNGALQYLVNRQIDENEQFELQMTQLLNLAKAEYYKVSRTSILPIGLDDVRTFVAEALTNGTFQAILQNITYDGPKSTPISMWSEFKKALFDFLSKIFRINPSKNDSLLDEVINLTAYTFDKQGTSGSNLAGQGGTTGGNSQPGGTPITQQTDIKEIMALPDLVTSLQNVYNNTYLPQQQATGETPDTFETFITTNPFAAYVIDQFNITTGRTGGGQSQTPGQSQGGSGSVNILPEVITDDAYRAFKNNEPVSDEILMNIKAAVEAGTLTPRQDEIYQVYKEAIDKAISQQSSVAINQVQLVNAMLNEVKNLTLADFFGDQENMPFSSGKPGDFTIVTMDGFALIRRGDLNEYLDMPLDFVFYANGQVKADGTIIDPKPYAASTTLNIPIDENTKPNVIQLINNLRVIQNKLDAIQAEVKAKLEVPAGGQTTTSTPVSQAQIDEIEKRREEALNAVGAKQKESAFEKLKEAKTAEDKLNAIHIIERNVAEGSVLTEAEKKEIQKVKDNLAAEGYEVYELKDKEFNQGMKVIVTNSIPDENLAEGEEIITKTISPQINKDDKMVQTAQIEVTVGTKKGGLTREQWLAEQKKKETRVDKINAKYDAELAALKAGTPTTTTDTQANRDTDLFPETTNFAEVIGNGMVGSTISNYSEVNGIGIAEYTGDLSDLVDVIMSGTSDNDYVGYVRIYDNGKPTSRWTSKMSNESGNKEAFKTMLSEVQSRLPADHEYTESTNISLEGLKLYAQQLNRGYEVLTDASGNPVMSNISLNEASKEGLKNAKSQKEKEDLYNPINVATREEFNKIREEILALMPNARVLYNQADNTVNIQLPVLKKKAGSTTKTEQEKTQEEEIDEEINSNPEDSEDVKEGESRIDDTSREVEQEIDEAQRRSNEGKTPPFSELAKETMQSIKDALGSVRDAMKKSYSRLPEALDNNYEKLRRAYKKTGGKLKEKLAKVLDAIQKYLRKLKQVLTKAGKTVSERRAKRGVQPIAGTPEMTSTKPEMVDNTREILADFVVEQLTQYGFVKFFAEQGMVIDANTILNLEALGTKRGDNVLLENRSTMENTLHRLLHAYMDKTGTKSDKDYNAQAQSLINVLRPILQGISEAGGDPNVGIYIDKINYMFDKNPAQELVIQYLTNTPFRSFISRLSPEVQAQFQSLAKEMVLFKDSAGRVTYNKTKSFIKMQDGLLMSDALYEEFINNTLQTPLDILGEAMASGMDPVTFLLNRIAQPIDTFIAEEATSEDLQEIADEEGKSITEVVTSIKNAVLNYLNTANFARNKTAADKAPRTKKDGIISRIIRRLKKITIGLMIALSTYTGVAGFDFSGGNVEAEPDTEMAEKPTWSMNNVVDNTMAILPISDSYKQTMYRGLIKYGIYDATAVKEEAINNEEISEAKVTVETNDTLEYVRQNTYFQNLGKARDSQGAKGDSILMYRNQWFNDVGFEYLTGASNSTRDRVGQTTYDNTVGVAHFYIMDNTGGDLSRYTTDAKFAEAKNNFKSRVGTYDIKPTDYVPVFKFMPRNETGENVVKMQFKLGSELTAEDNAITKLIQWKFGDIDFNSQVNLYKASYCLTTKSGDKAYSFTFSKKANGKDLYSRFSGSSVIFIFKDQKGNTIVREFTGSINGIKKEGESIMKQFQVKPEDLTIGAFDAGSFSAKPASKNGVLKSDQWDGFNKIHPNAGSALIIPIASTQKVIQLSDINPSEEEINNVAKEKTKSCQ
jgi:hypothetical protein